MMENNNKIVSVNTFDGGQNTDIADELMKSNQVRYYFNCLMLSSGDGSMGIVTNLKGNELIKTPLPDGENKCIGFATDEENKKVYFAVWNSNGYHSWLMFSENDKSITKVIECRTDTKGVEIWKWNNTDNIIHADVYHGKLLYWVLNGAWKINIQKCMDKSSTGYGDEIIEDYTRAYKKTSIYSPKATYITNPEIPYNMVYGALFSFATRFVYDDFEKSNYSDYSNVPIPLSESVQYQNSVSNNNNCIELIIETGSLLVTDIEVVMRKTMPDGSLSPWYLVAVINKSEFNIGNDSNYSYYFYNDGSYLNVDQEKVIRPHSYLPKFPKCQSLVRNALIYSNSPEGFESVIPDVEIGVSYEDLFDDSEYETVTNSPFIGLETDTWTEKSGLFDVWVHSVVNVTIGPDVRVGNKFVVWSPQAVGSPNWQITAADTDDNTSIANRLISEISRNSRIRYISPVTSQGQNVKFEFDFMHASNTHSKQFFASATPVQYSLLKDFGQNVRTFKLGSTRNFAIRYYDEDGRKSNGYFSKDMFIKFKSVNELLSLKKPIVEIDIKHIPPVWAKYWELVIGPDLTYNQGRFIQFLIQKVIPIKVELSGGMASENYLDLVVGSLFVYQKIHPNTNVKYAFTKGDRLRLIKKNPGPGEIYYNFYESEIIDYKDVVIDDVNDIIKTNGTTNVETTTADPSNVGLIIKIGDFERTITNYNSNGYSLDRPCPKTETYPNFQIINNLGSIRIKKPVDLTIDSKSIIEVFTPSSNTEDLGLAAFYEFGHKFPIIDWGTNNRMHGGDEVQTNSSPAKVKVSNGTSYVRKRVLPVNNSITNTQAVVTSIEDPSFSDFYSSALYDLGRPVPKDDRTGIVEFIDRCRYSNNTIEDTKINGFNDFDNLDRVDYNDNYGAIRRTVYGESKLYVFKELKSGWSPIYGRIIKDQSGQNQLSLYDKILSPDLSYYSFDGGIGNNPEGYVKNENNHYFISPGTVSICRVGGDGVDPISEIHNLDTETRKVLGEATRSNAEIHFGYDRLNRSLLVGVSDYDRVLLKERINSNSWTINDVITDLPTEIEIINQAAHGTSSIDGTDILYKANPGYVGNDEIRYRVKIKGIWSEVKVLTLVVEEQNIPSFSNTLQKKIFYKQCSGGSGSPVEYLVPAGKYISKISQTDADNQAIVEIESNGQNYANVHGTCLFVNQRQSIDFVKNDCLNDGSGSTVAVTVEEGVYTSVLSQSDANAKAINYINLNGQSIANTTGTCLWTNDGQEKEFYRTNCASGTMPDPFIYKVIAGKYSSTVSKNQANQLALNDIEMNGQSVANLNGICVIMVSVEYGYNDVEMNSSSLLVDSRNVKINSNSYKLVFSNDYLGKYISVKEPVGCLLKTHYQIEGSPISDISNDFNVVEENGYRYYLSKNPFFQIEVLSITFT